jgi:hypothetical protein
MMSHPKVYIVTAVKKAAKTNVLKENMALNKVIETEDWKLAYEMSSKLLFTLAALSAFASTKPTKH